MRKIGEGAGVVVRTGRHHEATAEHITVVPAPERRSQKCEGLARKHVEEGRVGLGSCVWALDGGLDPTPGVIGMPLSPEKDVNRMRLVAPRDPVRRVRPIPACFLQ